jgi:hypothetical protein
MLYKELNDMRGFSEDCARSLLHQLICVLVELTSVPDSGVSRTITVSVFLDNFQINHTMVMYISGECSENLDFLVDCKNLITAIMIKIVHFIVMEDLMDIVCSTDGGNEKCLQNFGWDI